MLKSRHIGRLAKAGRQRLGRAWRWLRRRHSPLGLLFLLALLGGAIFLALLPAQREAKAPETSAPRTIMAKAAPALTRRAPAVRPQISPERASPEQAQAMTRLIEEAALRPPPPLPAPSRAQPAWLRFAVPAPPVGNRPLVAIVLDDLGLDQTRTAEAIRLPGAVTTSFMTYANDLPEQTDQARRAGHELLLHVPMEAVDRREDPGPHALDTSLSRDQIVERLRWGLGRFEGYVGVNNHMGSKFTADAQGMAPVIAELRDRGLLFLDSRTTPRSVGFRLAAADGVPHAARDVFIDDDLSPAAIARQLSLVETVAHRNRSAIAIGHAHDTTLSALRAWLPTLAGKGLVLVPLSTVVRYRMATESAVSQ
ncbi:MAG TPA: divergent polysaccharide deacetylase family protein [Stellaceae bacterium]|nr:divergent polysaccharide deacetylase family protein [Stellaceae bacterium]